jgi:hypothetical protein
LKSGAGNRNRTYDLRITNAPLYQLSYSGKEPMILRAAPRWRKRDCGVGGPDNVKWQGRRFARRLSGRGLAGGPSILQVFRDPADNETTACAVRTWRV